MPKMPNVSNVPNAPNENDRCLHCGRTSDEIPLIRLRYHGSDVWICPPGLPVLIHQPEQLTALAGDWQKTGADEEQHGHDD